MSELRTTWSPVAASWDMDRGSPPVLKEVLVSATPAELVCGLTTSPMRLPGPPTPGFRFGTPVGSRRLSLKPVQSHKVSNGAKWLIPGKEKVSPGRTSTPSPAAPDSESVIVAMERVSVLFDR